MELKKLLQKVETGFEFLKALKRKSKLTNDEITHNTCKYNHPTPPTICGFG